MHVIKGSTVPLQSRGNLKIKVFPKDGTDKTEFIYVESETGHGGAVIQKECDFVYYIIEGTGYFTVNDAREDCEAGDLVVIPAGTKYDYTGKMKIVASSTPPWKSEQQLTV
jgi:mannose-6-phosphate isomerase-like protein (cupin superfamily)